MKLDNYLHFSEPKNLKKRSILEKGDLNPAIDFLDVLTDDIPKGESTELSYVSSHINKCHILQDLLQLLKQPNSQCKRSHCTFLQTTDKFNVFMLELRFFCPNPKESNGVVTKSYPNLIGVPFFHIWIRLKPNAPNVSWSTVFALPYNSVVTVCPFTKITDKYSVDDCGEAQRCIPPPPKKNMKFKAISTSQQGEYDMTHIVEMSIWSF